LIQNPVSFVYPSETIKTIRMKVKNKTIVVTGAGSGMGRELALQLVHKGARVAAVDLNPEALDETRHQAGGLKEMISLHVVDIADRKAVETFAEELTRQPDGVDGLINNAGIIQPFVHFNDLSYEVMQRVINVNLWGTVYMVKAFLPHLLTRTEAHIVNISSMGGFLPVPGQTLYGASKAATKILTEGLYSELKDTGVRVTIVFPGGVSTNIMTNSGLNMSELSAKQKKYKILTADQAVRKIIAAMEKNRFRVVVGSDARIMDFVYRLSPKKAAGLIYRNMKDILPGR